MQGKLRYKLRLFFLPFILLPGYFGPTRGWFAGFRSKIAIFFHFS